MFKHKSFTGTAAAIASWVNQRTATVDPVSVVSEKGKLILFYRDKTFNGADNAQTNIVLRHIDRLCNLDPDSKYRYEFPKQMHEKCACPFSRLFSTVRNLKQFKDLEPAQIRESIKDALDGSEYHLIENKTKAKALVGSRVVCFVHEDLL